MPCRTFISIFIRSTPTPLSPSQGVSISQKCLQTSLDVPQGGKAVVVESYQLDFITHTSPDIKRRVRFRKIKNPGHVLTFSRPATCLHHMVNLSIFLKHLPLQSPLLRIELPHHIRVSEDNRNLSVIFMSPLLEYLLKFSKNI